MDLISTLLAGVMYWTVSVILLAFSPLLILYLELRDGIKLESIVYVLVSPGVVMLSAIEAWLEIPDYPPSRSANLTMTIVLFVSVVYWGLTIVGLIAFGSQPVAPR